MNLKDKNVLITGATGGIGKSLVEKFYNFGAKIIATGTREEKLNKLKEEFPKIKVEKFDKVDVLVNNAAANPYYGPILNSEDSHWDKIFDVNVKGYFNFAKACSETMIANNSGKIINVASIAAKTPLEGLGVYNISKAAVVMLTKVLAKELGVHNINVNTLAPGLIKTDFSKALWENEDTYNKIVKSIPQGKMGSPDDISGMALYLASEASDFVTGSIFTVDGGITT